MKTRRPFAPVRRAALAALLVPLAACSDDPVGVEEEHSAPAVVEIAFGDVVVARAFSGFATGSINVAASGETPELTMTFLDDESALVTPGPDEYLEVETADGFVAVWEPTSPGAFAGRFQGVSIGETTAVIRFMHGSPGSGHADFVSAPVTVIVN